MTNSAETQASRKSHSLMRARAVVTAAAVAASLLAGCSTEKEEPKRPKPQKPSQGESGGASDGPEKKDIPFSPYVDASLRPPYNLVEGAKKTGVKEYNLAFVSPGGGCEPMWGGRQKLSANPVARQADELRAEGGDIRISFGGQSGNELARECSSVDQLVQAYNEVIDAFALTKVDFDLEGHALTDTKANTLRARAIVRLQQQRADLDVSFTLPTRPAGLNRDGIAVLNNAKRYGARISTVNIMAMDYGTYYDGDMGEYAVSAAAATQKQVKTTLGIQDDDAAWRTVAVTPMIGVNDVKVEVFRPEDAVELREFAERKGLGGLSMWSAARDKPCPGGANTTARATCSSIGKGENEFAEALTG